MAKCPHCEQILSDEWVKKQGASLMGKTAKGEKKRRSNAKAAARERWGRKVESVITKSKRSG